MPYIGEVMLFAGPYEIEGWVRCDGRMLPIQNYQALYSILGNAYGGDGIREFALPNLKDRLPLQAQTARHTGLTAGASAASISQAHLPLVTHPINAPDNTLKGVQPEIQALTTKSHGHVFAMPTNGKAESVPTMPPTLTMNYLICVEGGDYPPRIMD